jgi:hypothetical protein
MIGGAPVQLLTPTPRHSHSADTVLMQGIWTYDPFQLGKACPCGPAGSGSGFAVPARAIPHRNA